MKWIWYLIFLLSASYSCLINAQPISKDKDSALCPRNELCFLNQLEIGVEALYLRPVMDDVDTLISSKGTQGHTHYFEKKLDWSFGFKLEADYHLATNKNLFINWYHYKKSNRQDFFDNYSFASKGQEVEATYLRLGTPIWEAVNLGVDQAFQPVSSTEVHFSGGLQFAVIKTGTTIINLTSSNLQVVAPGDYETHSLALNGVGPRFGFLFSVFPIDKLNIYIQAGATILVGDSHYSGYEGLDIVFAVPKSGDSLTGSKTWTTFPSLDEKLGVSYTYDVGANNLTLDAGYFCVNYFKAQQLGKLQTDVNFIGFYAGMSLRGDFL